MISPTERAIGPSYRTIKGVSNAPANPKGGVRAALEVLGHAAGGDVLDLQLLGQRGLEREALGVCREKQHAVRLQPLDRIPDQRAMVALDIEVALHAMRARIARRIEEDHAEALAGFG